MDLELQSPQQNFNKLYGYTMQEETTLILHYHDAIFKNATVFNAAGELLFQFRHESFETKNRWKIEDSNDRKLCSLAYEKITSDNSSLNATVHTLAGEDALVLMLPQGKGCAWTNIIVGGIIIAKIRNFIDNARTMEFEYYNNDQSTWEIHVAAGVDLSIIVFLALSRAEMAHVWKQ
ncbi:hypothetical protein GGR55DRAFT_687593 [Xylaria sp. FL0064]|nr:hypothetical protein GGR55DRAFT_687593 [Xylaria sp. FL0064]